MKLQYLMEIIAEPTEEDKQKHQKRKPQGGKLHYVVKDEEGKKVLTYVDEKYVNRMRDKIKYMKGREDVSPFYKKYVKKEKERNILQKLLGKSKISPKDVAKIRLSQIEYFKRNK
jgi:GTP1/Obg family GTP-binding protein